MRLLFLLVLPCWAQATLTLQCPASVKAGAVLTYSVVLSGNAQPSDLQWLLTADHNIGGTAQVASGSAAIAQKTVTQNANGLTVVTGSNPTTGTINAMLILDGVVSTVTATIPTQLANTTVMLGLSGTLGAKPPGVPVVIPLPNACVVSVLPSTNFCDVNGDGVVDGGDVKTEQSAVLSIPQQVTMFDRNGDGKLDVVDIQIIENAALGKPCTATQ